MKRCFVIPGPFVPANEPMTQLVYKQLRLLPFEMEVCALRYWETDDSLAERIKSDPEWKKFHVTYTDDYRNVLFSIRNVFLPSCLHHVKKYIQNAAELYQGQEYVYTSSFPAYTIRAAELIRKKNPSVTWIANFTDPINHSPYALEDRRTYQEYSLPEKIAFRLYCRYYVTGDDEAAAMEDADILLFICEEQRDFMIENYVRYYGRIPGAEIRSKSVIVPLNYIPEWNLLKPAEEVHNNPFLLSHFGRIYGLRNIDEFLEAVAIFVQKHPNFSLRIEQYGEFRKSDLGRIQELGISELFAIHEKIPYEDCIRKMGKSDAVLIFDTILPADEIQPYLPSKVLEYSLLKKNTLGITTRRSPTYRIMKASDAVVADNDRNEIVSGLEDICIRRKKSVINYASTNEQAVQNLLYRIALIEKEKQK